MHEKERVKGRKSYTINFKLKVVYYAEENSNLKASRNFGVHRRRIQEWRCQKNQLIEQIKQSKGDTKRLNGGGRKSQKDDRISISINTVSNNDKEGTASSNADDDNKLDLLEKVMNDLSDYSSGRCTATTFQRCQGNILKRTYEEVHNKNENKFESAKRDKSDINQGNPHYKSRQPVQMVEQSTSKSNRLIYGTYNHGQYDSQLHEIEQYRRINNNNSALECRTSGTHEQGLTWYHHDKGYRKTSVSQKRESIMNALLNKSYTIHEWLDGKGECNE